MRGREDANLAREILVDVFTVQYSNECYERAFYLQTNPIIANSETVIIAFAFKFLQIREVLHLRSLLHPFNNFLDTFQQSAIFDGPQISKKTLFELGVQWRPSNVLKISSRLTGGLSSPSSIA